MEEGRCAGCPSFPQQGGRPARRNRLQRHSMRLTSPFLIRRLLSGLRRWRVANYLSGSASMRNSKDIGWARSSRTDESVGMTMHLTYLTIFYLFHLLWEL